MDIYNSDGLSWADQWDPEPLPSETYEKKKDGADKSKKKSLNLKWMKIFSKKSKNNDNYKP
ncbi:hypothetical protein ACS0TY_023886 [Phlomoides rotata]